ADFTLMPLRTRSLFWNGASDERIGDRVKLVSVPFGSQLSKMVPLAVKTMTRRFGGVVAPQTLRGSSAVPAKAAPAPSRWRRERPRELGPLTASPPGDSERCRSG